MALIDVRGMCRKKYKLLAKYVAEKVISLMNFPDNLEVAINFVSKKEIKRLNREFRNIKQCRGKQDSKYDSNAYTKY